MGSPFLFVLTKGSINSSVLLFDRIREIQELPTLNSSLHMSFTGRPGTGKTSVAAKLGLVLRQLGYLTKGHITNVTREDLVGQYVGHTAPKTKEQLNKAIGECKKLFVN